MSFDPAAAPAAAPADLPSQAELVAGLRARLAPLRVSMARLCARARVSHTTPGRWESGESSLSWDLYQRLHAALLQLEAEHTPAPAPLSGGSVKNLAPQSGGFSGEGAGGAV